MLLMRGPSGNEEQKKRGEKIELRLEGEGGRRRGEDEVPFQRSFLLLVHATSEEIMRRGM